MSLIILPSTDPSYGITVGEMIDEVKTQLRNDKIDQKIFGWINFTMFQLASQYEFPFLHSLASLSLTDGERSYLLAPNLYWLKMAWIDGQYPPLFPTTEQDISAADTYFTQHRGKVTHYILHDRAIDFWKIPTQDTTVKYYYQRRPSKLVGLSDMPDFPYEWQPLLIQGAKVKGYEYERNPLLQEARDEFRLMKKEQTKNLYHRPDFPIVARDIPRFSSTRIPGPLLPPNFPRT